MTQVNITNVIKLIKHNLRELLAASGMKQSGLERVTQLSHPTIARMCNENDPSAPDLINLISAVKALGGSLDKICGLVSDEIPMDASAQIADNAINAYSELLILKDAQIADKDKQIEEKNRQIARYERILDILTQQLEAKRD